MRMRMNFTKGLIAGGVIGAMLSSKAMNQRSNQQGSNQQDNQNNGNVTKTEYIKETSIVSGDTMV